jgi:hypothetical protein
MMVWEFDWDGGRRRDISSAYRILVGKIILIELEVCGKIALTREGRCLEPA